MYGEPAAGEEAPDMIATSSRGPVVVCNHTGFVVSS